MKRNGYIVLSAAVLAWVVAAIVTGSLSLGLSGGSTATTTTASASSPACLPTTFDHSASLPGTDVDVSPEPESVTANPDTQISFLGTSVANIREVSVVGSKSGDHAGSLHAYSQGDGASFVPAKPFQAGERVVVRAVIGAGAGGKPVTFGFRVDYPYPTADVPEFGNPQAAPADYQSFDTMPGVQAPILTVTVPDRDPAAGDILTTNGPGPGQYGPLIYTPQGRLVWFDKLPGGRNGGGPQRADLRRPARLDLVAGAGAVAGLRPGRRRRHELRATRRSPRSAAATACTRTCTSSSSSPTTSPTSPRSTRSAATCPRRKARATGRSSTRRSRRST